MKHFLKTTVTLLTAALLCAALMTGCTRLTEAKDNTPSTTGTPSAAGEFGVYVKLERDDASSVRFWQTDPWCSRSCRQWSG